MAQIMFWEAIRRAHDEEMANDPLVICMGEDIGVDDDGVGVTFLNPAAFDEGGVDHLGIGRWGISNNRVTFCAVGADAVNGAEAPGFHVGDAGLSVLYG